MAVKSNGVQVFLHKVENNFPTLPETTYYKESDKTGLFLVSTLTGLKASGELFEPHKPQFSDL